MLSIGPLSVHSQLVVWRKSWIGTWRRGHGVLGTKSVVQIEDRVRPSDCIGLFIPSRSAAGQWNFGCRAAGVEGLMDKVAVIELAVMVQ
jgi:hypothetical protein